MAATACDASILLVSITHGSTALGIPVAFKFEEAIVDVFIRKPGKTGPGCRGVVAQDLVCVADFLVKPPIAPGTAAATLTITMKDAGGDDVIDTLATMIPRGYSEEMNRDSPPAVWRQRFVHVGDMDSDPVGSGGV
jgi:hypothetical protein